MRWSRPRSAPPAPCKLRNGRLELLDFVAPQIKPSQIRNRRENKRRDADETHVEQGELSGSFGQLQARRQSSIHSEWTD